MGGGVLISHLFFHQISHLPCFVHWVLPFFAFQVKTEFSSFFWRKFRERLTTWGVCIFLTFTTYISRMILILVDFSWLHWLKSPKTAKICQKWNNIVGKMVLPAPISKRSFSHLQKYFGSNLPNLPKFNPNLPSPKYPITGIMNSILIEL